MFLCLEEACSRPSNVAREIADWQIVLSECDTYHARHSSKRTENLTQNHITGRQVRDTNDRSDFSDHALHDSYVVGSHS